MASTTKQNISPEHQKQESVDSELLKMFNFGANGIPSNAKITTQRLEQQTSIVGSEEQLKKAKELGLDLDSFFH